MGLSLLPHLPTDLQPEPWRVLRVQSGKEANVQASLGRNGAVGYSPLAKQRRQWSDRVKVTRGALFPSYVFARFDLGRWVEIKETTPHVFDLVRFGHETAIIPDSEIERVMLIANSEDAEGWPTLVVGKPVRIIHGCLAGVQGVLAELRGAYRVAVNVDMLGRAVTTMVDRSMVEMVK